MKTNFSLKWLAALVAAFLLLTVGSSLLINILPRGLFAGRLPEPTEKESAAIFAKCLRKQELRMYGTEWCANCQRQEQMFGDSFDYIPYIDCDEQPGLCQEREIKGYPVWEDAAGKQYPGLASFEGLSMISGCPKPADLADLGVVEINIALAFIAGLLSFFAPCLLPLLPSYFSAITGFTFKDMYGLNFAKLRGRFFLSTILFVLGFSIVFTFLGATATTIGQFVQNNLPLLLQFSGAVLILLGLVQLGVIRFNALRFDYAWKVQKKLSRLSFFSALTVGIISALAWIPCVGPILGSILLLATLTSSVQEGALLLFVYSLGIGTPFLAISLSFPTAVKHFQAYRRELHYLSLAAGVVMIAFGLILILNKYRVFLSWLGI